MRIALLLLASASVLLGLWLIATGFMPPAATAAPAAARLSAPAAANTAGPIMLGLALLGGGVLFFVLLFRRA